MKDGKPSEEERVREVSCIGITAEPCILSRWVLELYISRANPAKKKRRD